VGGFEKCIAFPEIEIKRRGVRKRKIHYGVTLSKKGRILREKKVLLLESVGR